MDHTIRGGDHSNYHRDFGGRSNEFHSSNTSMEIQHLPPFPSRPPFNPHAHASTNGNTSFPSTGPVGHIHSARGISESGGPHKRKTPGVFECSSSTLYGAESSSSSQMLIHGPAVDHLSQPPCRGSNLSINSQDLITNVRTRSEPGLEPCWTRVHVPNYASHCYQPTTPSANCSATVPQEQNIVPYAASYHGRILHSDTNHPRCEISRFYGGTSSVNTNASRHNPFIRGNLASSSPNPHAQPARDGCSYHYQRVTPFNRNNDPNGVNSSTNELPFPSYDHSSRYSYNAAGERGSGYRVRRPRIAFERPQPLVDMMDSGNGFGHETVTVEHQSFYHEATNFPDIYQDMRLDIDSMSYEDLLALEERIGYVCHGLSEDEMSNCLREQTYSSMDQNHDPCPICLEEYKNGEKIGRIEKCGHDYHVDCIKKWMVMKKVCPICKSEC